MQWRRIFRSRGFYLSIAVQVFAYLYPHMDASTFWFDPLGYFGSADLLYFFLMPRNNGLCIILLSFVAVLPAATQIAEDVQSGYIRFLLERTGRRRYFCTRIVQAAAGGMIASLAGSLIYLGMIMLLCPWNDHILVSWRKTLSLGSYAPLLQLGEGFVIAEGILRFALEAVTWALIGFSYACFFPLSGLPLALTFMTHYGVIYLMNSFPSLSNLYSPETIAAPYLATDVPLSIYTEIQLLYLTIALGTCILSARTAAKRLGHQMS